MTRDESDKVDGVCDELGRVAAILDMIALATENAGPAADVESAIGGAASYLRQITADLNRLAMVPPRAS